MPDDNSDPDPMDKTEPLGKGLNEFMYFVSNDILADWIQLPIVTPDQIKLARQMRRFLTGDLKAPVLGYPRFPYPEECYLRAQIARIAGATSICPKGLYVSPDDADADLVEDEEFKGIPVSELKTADGWVHSRPYVLKQGRAIKWQAPDQDENEEQKQEQKEPEEEEDEVARLRGVGEDALDGLTACWSFKSEPNPVPSSSFPFPNAVACVQSLTWPGAYAVAQTDSKNTTFCNVYIGYGLKYLGKSYVPPPIPQIQSEFVSKKKSEDDDDAAAVDLLQEQMDPLPPPPEPVPEDQPADDDANDNGDDADAADDD